MCSEYILLFWLLFFFFFFFFKGKKASTASRTFTVKQEKQHLFKVQKNVGVNMKPTAVIVSENAVRDVVA